MKTETKYIYRIYDTKKEEWITHFSWDASYIAFDKKVNSAKKWGSAKTLSNFLVDRVEGENAENFNEIPDTWQIRKFKVKIEVNELENEAGSLKEFVYAQIRWPQLHKFWVYPYHEWHLKAACDTLPENLDPQFVISFDGGHYFNTGQPEKQFDVDDVRRLLIKAKKRMTGEMRVLLRYRKVFVSNETDLSIIKMMLNEHVTYILNMETGLDPAGKKIKIDYPF